jgi:tRNA modification GTPase
MDSDTIVALSTPPGESGIAVVRMSGSRAIRIIEATANDPPKWISHRAYKRTLLTREGEHIDEALIVVMKSPNSYTGEDVVEISCHGSMQAATELIEETLRHGARAAEPGEFTKRAFLSGRMDLVQAEAVADLIAAETKLQRKVALELLEGGLSAKLAVIEEKIREQLALIEVSIDFSEEDIAAYDPAEAKEVTSEARERIGRLLESEVAGRKLRSGIRITILGPRNAGKSSLYNSLIGEERAIVSPIPGTTRDILRERIHIGGFTYYLEDTAGIAETGCEIEAKGISIGRKAAGSAALVLFVVDGSGECRPETAKELRMLDTGKMLCVVNKSDLGLRFSAAEAAEMLGVKRVAVVSAQNGEGLEGLRQWIYESTIKGETGRLNRERIAINARHGAALREADEALGRFEHALDGGAPAEILSMEIRAAAEAIGTITGKSIVDDLLDTIFDRFCIGK